MSVAMQRVSLKSAAVSARPARVAIPRLPISVRPRNAVVMRSTPTEEDPTAKLQEQVSEAGKWLQTKWDETSDAEKPAAVAIIIGATIAQIAIGATVDAVDRLPFIHQFLEFVGLAVVSVYGYRYITDPTERDSVRKSLDSFVEAVTGADKPTNSAPKSSSSAPKSTSSVPNSTIDRI